MEGDGEGVGVRKGAWSKEEDILLKKCIEQYGEGKWSLIPSRAGLNRCRKSCRLRWLNYLKPTIKRGKFAADEVDLIIRLHNLLGNRWSLIAGRLPGRTANDVKNYWNTHLPKKFTSSNSKKSESKPELNPNPSNPNNYTVIRPRPRRLSVKNVQPVMHGNNNNNNNYDENVTTSNNLLADENDGEMISWWKALLMEDGNDNNQNGLLGEESNNNYNLDLLFSDVGLWN